VVLASGESCAVAAGCPLSVENAGATSAVFLSLQGIGEHDFVRSGLTTAAAYVRSGSN